ncbi:threonine-phosphate decarboxylase CobD [Roseovarius autotrophicus]|uniref:threonine-phosphate decarboxylase CobD n=1 Tax=Roseovarius autotrophicus TaxID=2824121 RepID=UPI0019DD0D41|nr:threonine-phosphate decarboxylase CobD [Roseovarius autotrophicus]MBE0452941.1 threonine-phosphate decarboxylase [Roseovarius sp.]
MTALRDHGGNLDAARLCHGGAAAEWLDLSTGINPVPYPMPVLSARALTALPTREDMAALSVAAAACYGTNAEVVPLAGAQGAIQAVPYLAARDVARVLGPTYNEHAAALRAAGWAVAEVAETAALAGADLAVVVNPNNPCGRRHAPEALLALAGQVGCLVVDESFADPEPGLSLAPMLDGVGNVVVLRSFGKFYGLAGLRLGFALCGGALAKRLREMAGPWPVSGPAIEAGRVALGDADWQRATRERLVRDAMRLDALAEAAGWRLIGGTPLFRSYHAPEAAEAQERLARARIWTRIFPWSGTWIRLGLPGPEEDWARLAAALRG